MADKAEYLMMKRGLYECPEHRGYTGIKEHAGRFDRSEESPDHGITAIHETIAPEYAPKCFEDVKAKHMQGRIERLHEQIVSLGGVPVC